VRLCSGPGCRRAIPDGKRFCDECQPCAVVSSDDIRAHSRNDGGYDAELKHLNKGTRWQGIRRRVVMKHPLCARCQERISEIVDHIVPAAEAIQQARDSGRYPCDKNAGYYLISNLQGLCRECHGKKTAEDKAHVGPWPSVVDAEDRAPKKRWTF
jgi:5-methylcytosine-specific restriction protein A